MAQFSEMLTYLRKRSNLSQQDLADKLKLTRSAISMYETGKREPDFETLEAFADFFNVDMNTLTGFDNSTLYKAHIGLLPMPSFTMKPRLGTIACGNPTLAIQETTEYDSVPDYIHCDFTLKCKGDSMINARIFDGDIVYIRRQETVENGEIAAVLIDDEATLKRVRIFEDHLSLEPENPQYRPLVFWGEEMNNVHIIGKAVAFTSNVR